MCMAQGKRKEKIEGTLQAERLAGKMYAQNRIIHAVLWGQAGSWLGWLGVSSL